MTNKERMNNQKLYDCTDPELAAEQLYYFELLYDYNHTRPGDSVRKQEILSKLLGGMGKDCYIEQPFHANWGKNTYFGEGVYANFNLTLVDDEEIRVGNYVLFGPNVNVVTGSHPIEPNLRSRGYQFNIPVEIGNNVWIGAGATILPGVHIGDNSVIGAGSVVTKDIPANVVAVGNPCRVLREIGEHDRKYYFRDLKVDVEIEE